MLQGGDSYFGLSLAEARNQLDPGVVGRTGFDDLVMAQLLLRPSKPLRRAVEGFLARAVGFGQAFNAVHLRDFEGTCVKRCRPENIASQSVTEADLGRPVTCEDFCNMTDA